MSATHLDILLRTENNLKLSLGERLLLFTYCFWARKEDNSCGYGYSRIGQQIGKDKANVKKLCDSLRAKGLLKLNEDRGVIVCIDEISKHLPQKASDEDEQGGDNDHL